MAVEGYGDVLLQLNDNKAVEIFNEFFEKCEQHLGWDDHQTVVALQNLTNALRTFQMTEDAVKLQVRLAHEKLPSAAMQCLSTLPVYAMPVGL